MKFLVKIILNKKLVAFILKYFAKVKVMGLDNIKDLQGKYIFITNHNSFIDAILLWAFIPEELCFTINPIIAKKWYIKPLLNIAKFFQIDSSNPMAVKSIIDEVNKGQKLVIYPEGRVTTTGSMMKIYPGPAMIADKADAKIVPIHIEGTQYKIFSPFGNNFRVKPKSIITLSILKPTKIDIDKNLKGDERKKELTKQLYDIMTNAKYNSLSYEKTLFESLIEAKDFVGRKKKIVEDIARKPINYGQLLTAAFVLGKQFTKHSKQKEYVGFLMPNAVASIVAIYGMQAYNIVPCMLNFSTGTKNMISCCKTAAIKTVYTSKQFVIKGGFTDLIKTMEQEGLKIIYLEDLKKEITLKEKLTGLIASYFPRHYYNKIKGTVSSKDPAVILFTSGSEGVPKGVALSHENIQANLNQIKSVLFFDILDNFFMALPIFHSFGFTCGMILPITSGIKVFFYPTPLHYKIIPELIYDTNSTITFTTPTFFSGYGKNAHAYDFYSIRIAVVGAEKVKEETVKSLFTNFGISLLEGYGATETAPVLSVNTPLYHKKGSVGRIFPGIQVRLDEVPGIKDGRKLVVKGKNVMLGYIKSDKPGIIQPPEDGWYDTGDIVSVDKDNFITIKGRAKRFAKIAGEMVSLTAVEEMLSNLWQGYQHAVVSIPDEKKGEQLVLFTTKPNAVFSEISANFKAQGSSDLFVPKKIKVLEEMLVMGNGKIDYVNLTELAKKEFN